MGSLMCRMNSSRSSKRKRKRRDSAVAIIVAYNAKDNVESYPGAKHNPPEPTRREIAVPLLKCTSCLGTYGDVKLPRNLCCGHSLCTGCIEKHLPDKLICLECSVEQKADKITSFPVNYQLLRVSRSTKTEEIHIPNDMSSSLAAKIPPSNPLLEDWKCTIHGSPLAMFCCTCNVWICEDCLVLDHVIPPRGVCKITGIAEAMERIKVKYGETGSDILKEIEAVKVQFDVDITLHDFCLKHCVKARSHIRLIKEAEPLLEGKRAENELEVNQVKERLKKLTDSANVTTPDVLTHCCQDLLSFREDLKAFIETEQKRLLAPMQPILSHWRLDLKKLAEGIKPVYAIFGENQDCKWAEIAVRDNRLLLYSLNEGTPPSDGITVPYEYVKKLIPSSEPTIFLEIEVAEENLTGRVCVGLTWNCPLVRQMLLLCSGEKGISLKNTRFFKYDKENGRLSGGDYENNDGTGGTPIISGLANETEEPCTTYFDQMKIGALLGEMTSTKFHFNFKVAAEELPYTIGYVKVGLKLLKAVTKLDLVSKTVIKDCGVCIPMNPPPVETPEDSPEDTSEDTPEEE
ncbi:uncharacterized protein LOC135196262 [Macrobrachium nipponense]|uniref:uncharacterized protein LOC135196262 n=1 Tax=Macrobrachium nipponense TaxID=159736 RepID=UPI0030C8031C